MNALKSLYQRLRTALPKSAAQVAQDEDYASRIVNETQWFSDCEEVHHLPPIFHYWSHKYLGQPKLQPFGITDPEQFFFLYARKFQSRLPERHIRMVSIGCGNCDMEARLARRLIDDGIANFTIECMDINETMLTRGNEHAAGLGVGDHIRPLKGDFNRWKPKGTYDIVIANQCLHHVLELENLFAAIRRCLNPDGYFLTSDMIGRNGHQRWPEALAVVQEFWKELPDSYRYNRLMKRHEPEYINHDCSTHGFEGIRAQDIMPLLIKNFQFELFIPFANVIFSFIDRPFGHNFNAEAQWDRDFIDRVHARDEAGILSGEFPPTQMLAVLRTVEVETILSDPRLTPAFCVRAHQAER